MSMPDSKLAVTLFNLRDFCQNESDLDRTLARVRAIGYEAVQVSGTPEKPAVIRQLLDKNGLYCCAAHTGMAAVKEANGLIDDMKAMGCDFVALGAPGLDYLTDEKFGELVDIMNTSGEKLAANGIKLAYHNHHYEFCHMADGKTYMEKFYDMTDPAKVWAEIDVHWVTRGGQNPVRWIEKVAGRMPVCHFKDFYVQREDGTPNYCEVGEGNLAWDEIIAACEKTGVRWYSVEQDMPYPGRDIFDSITISFNNLRKLGVN